MVWLVGLVWLVGSLLAWFCLFGWVGLGKEYLKCRRKCKYFKTSFACRDLKRVSKEYKRVLRNSYRRAQNKWHSDLKQMKSKCPKDYWKRSRDFTTSTCPLDVESVYEHFKSLNSDSVTQEDEFEDIDYVDDFDTDNLNRPRSIDEINNAINTLKIDKAFGIDEVNNVYIKYSAPVIAPILCKLFNKVLNEGVVPSDWTIGLIKPLYKGKGDRTKCDNYRGITLLSCIGKLFTSILNCRLSSFMEKLQFFQIPKQVLERNIQHWIIFLLFSH